MRPIAPSHLRLRRERPARKALVALELLLNLPIVLLVFLAVIEFGQLFSNLQLVALASRVGAERGAQLAALPNGGSVPSEVLNVIAHHLETASISYSKVVLEHNVGGTSVLTSGTGSGTPPTGHLPTSRQYVRVTVFVPASELAPNVLNTFGIDAANWVAHESTTFRYELSLAGQ